MGELHELVDCNDWEGIIQLLAQQGSDEARRDLASQRNEEGNLALHYPELYEPGALVEVVEAIIDAYPGALTQPKSEMYPLHVALDTMLETQDQEDSEDAGYDAHYCDIIQLLLQRAPQVAQYPTHQGMLPIHFGAQLNVKGLVELILSAYPRGACKSTADEHHNYTLPLHLVCQSKSRAEDILILLQEYPDAAQYNDYWTAMEDDEEDGNATCMPNRYPLHHLCANREFWTSSDVDSSAAKAAFLKLHQAHPEAAAYVDHMGRTPLSLLCENINPLQSMDSLTYLLQHSDRSTCIAQDCTGRLPLHYLAGNMSIAIPSCHESRACGSSDPIRAWKRLAVAHPQVLFCEDRQEDTPLSLLLLSKKIGVRSGSSVLHMLLQASFDCCIPATVGLKFPISETILMTPLSHLLAFFATALCPAEQEFIDVFKQSLSQETATAVYSQGNNVLHMACHGLHWATQEYNDTTALVNTTGDEKDAEANRLSAEESTDADTLQHDEEGLTGQDEEADVAIQITHETVTESSRRQVLLEFLMFLITEEEPLVQMVNHRGQLPIHILLSSTLMNEFRTNTTTHIKQEEAVRLLIRAYPESGSISDPTTLLAPFMAASERSTLTSSFELVQSFVAITDLFECYTLVNTHHRTSMCVSDVSVVPKRSCTGVRKSDCHRACNKRQKCTSISFLA
jgi:ankyrin repeat protein